MHRDVSPAIHYWGTPVVLVSTLNPDGGVNISPMSSAWWLGWSCMLGFDATSQTVHNLARERECVLNLASVDQADAVNALALTTGSASVPLHKRLLGYERVADKLGRAGLSAAPSALVKPPRVAECPVQLEAVVVRLRPFAKEDARMAVPACAVEVRLVKAHVDEALLSAPDRIDPDRWRPLIMSFRQLYGLGARLDRSRLASGDEAAYAPWKKGPFERVAARAVGAMLKHRHEVPDDDDRI